MGDQEQQQQVWRDNSEKVEVPSPLDDKRVKVVEVTRSNIPTNCFRRKLNVLDDLLQNFNKGGSKATLHSLRRRTCGKTKRIIKIKRNSAVRFIADEGQFSELTDQLKSLKFKIADPKTDFNVTHAVSTMSCYDKVPREMNQVDLSDCNSMDDRPEVTNKLENVSIECDTLCYQDNSAPCMELVEKTLALGVLNNGQGAITFSRSHREYCTNMINPQLNEKLEIFVAELSRLQRNLYNRNNVKGKSKRRYYAGFKEIEKRLQLKKIKLVIIAPDLDKKKGELDDLVHRFIDCCKRYEIPFIFGLSRRKLGYLTHGKGFVSCIGVANYEALEDKLDDALRSVLEAKNEFKTLKGDTDGIVDEKKILTDDLLLSTRVKLLLKTLASS